MSRDPRYVALPRDEGERSRGDLEDFLTRCEDPECRRSLEAALATPDLARYRETLLRHPREEARFFHFKEVQALERAQGWLASQGVPFTKPKREI